MNGINDKADKGYGDEDVNRITKIINPGMKGDKERRSYFHTALDILKVRECKNLTNPAAFDPNAKSNIYEVRIATHQVNLIQNAGDSCKQYEYRVYNANNILIQTYQLVMNDYNMMPFPETGPNWGRFGGREAGGDNWADKNMTGKLLGLFYELPTIGYHYTLYYNDISPDDGRYIGHHGHKTGNDIDIRYPGVENTDGEKLWGDSEKSLGVVEFKLAMEFIFNTAELWGMKHNYSYKDPPFHNVTNAAQNIHKNHFHLGYR